jgi:hypothetical protein
VAPVEDHVDVVTGAVVGVEDQVQIPVQERLVPADDAEVARHETIMQATAMPRERGVIARAERPRIDHLKGARRAVPDAPGMKMLHARVIPS